MSKLRILLTIAVAGFVTASCSSSDKAQERSSMRSNPGALEDLDMDSDVNIESRDSNSKGQQAQNARPAPDKKENINDLYRRFNQLRMSKQVNNAVEVAGEILAQKPEDVQVLNGLATMYIAVNKLEAARLVLGRAMAKAPNESALHNNAGLIELKAGDLRSALNSFKRAIELDGRNRFARANLGVVYLQYRNFTAAAEQLGEAVKRGDKRPEILSNYGYSLRATGQIERAVQAYEKAVEGSPQNVPILMNFATLLVEQAGRPKRGLKVINKVRMLATEPDILERARELAKKAEGDAKSSSEKEISE